MSLPVLASAAEDMIQGRSSGLTREEALLCIHLPLEEMVDLFQIARRVTSVCTPGTIRTCALCNAKSGRCSQDCAFCAQSAHHSTQTPIYPLQSVQELVDSALAAQDAGASSFSMVTSGEWLSPQELESIAKAVVKIKERTDLMVCGSLGMLTPSMAQALVQSGLDRFHHNLETARSYFPQVCTTHTYDQDIQTLESARDAGLEICCGGILGLGESWEQRVELAFTLRDLDVQAIPLNFLNPIPGTGMADRPLVQPLRALQCIALFRLINPTKEIIICGGREVTLGDFQSWIFMAGASGLMLGNYLTTQGRSASRDLEMIREQGLMC